MCSVLNNSPEISCNYSMIKLWRGEDYGKRME